MAVEFFVAWTVQPKQSVRATRGGRFYKPSKVQKNEDALLLLCSQHRPTKPLEGPLRAIYRVTYPWLKAHSQTTRRFAPKSTLPDCDNLAKQLSDCLAKAGFYANDSQIWDLEVTKCHGDSPGVLIRLEECG